MLALIVCLAAATLWAQDSIQPLLPLERGIVVKPWFDSHFHACGIRMFRDARGYATLDMHQNPASSDQWPAKLYTCPMAEHADIVSDKPGVCPKCDMKLVDTAKVNHGEQAEENWRRQQAEKRKD